MADTSRFVVPPNHTLYLRAAKREAQTWGRGVVEDQRRRRPKDHPLIRANFAQLVSGKAEETDWIDWFAKSTGHFQRGLSLGAGTGIVEERLLKARIIMHLDAIDISADALESFSSRMTKQGLGDLLTTDVQDLNFIELPEGQYDFILAHTALHHIINLEHLLEQVRRALTPKGILLVHDFIGPTAWQWDYDHMQEANKALELFRARYPKLDFNLVRRPDHEKLRNFSPFESVRSSEILGMLRHSFTAELEILTDRMLFLWLNYGIELKDEDDDDQTACLTDMVEWENQLRLGSEIPPFTLWGLYRAGSEPLPQPPSWDAEELNERIGVKRFCPRSIALGLLDRLPARDRLARTWMKSKRRFGWY